jgi:chromosome segregation ATPase
MSDTRRMDTHAMDMTTLLERKYDDSVKSLSDAYDDRIKGLSRTLVRTLHQMQGDDVLAMLQKDSASGAFIQERISEILEGTVSLERELMLKTVMKKLATQSTEHQQLKLRWNSLVEKVKNRESLLDRKGALVQQELAEHAAANTVLKTKVQQLSVQLQQTAPAAQEHPLLRQEIQRLDSELKTERDSHTQTAQEYEKRLKDKLGQKDAQMDAHMKDWKDQFVRTSTSNEQKLRISLQHQEKLLADEAAQNALLKRDNAHLEENLRAAVRNTESALAEKLKAVHHSHETVQLKCQKLERALAEVMANSSRGAKDQIRQNQDLLSKYQRLRQKCAVTEKQLENSERERLQVRSKYLKLGEQIETLVQDDQFQAKNALAKEKSRANKLRKRLNEERVTRHEEHEKFKILLAQHEQKAGADTSLLKDYKREIDMLQDSVDSCQKKLTHAEKLRSVAAKDAAEEYRKTIASLSDKVRGLERELDQTQNFNRKLEADVHVKATEAREKLSELKLDYDRRLQEAHTTHTEYLGRASQEQTQSLESKFQQYKVQLDDRDSIIKSLKEALHLRDTDISVTHISKDSFAREIENKVLEYEKDWTERRDEQDKMRSERHEMHLQKVMSEKEHEHKEATHSLRTDLEKHRERLERLREHTNKLEISSEMLRTEGENFKKQIVILTSQLHDTKSESAMLTDKLKETNNTLSAVQLENETAKRQCTQLTAELAQSSAHATSLEDMKKFNEGEINQLKDERRQSQAEQNTTSHKLQDLEHERDRLLHNVESLKEQLNRETGTLADTRKKLAGLEQEMHDLERDLLIKDKAVKGLEHAVEAHDYYKWLSIHK